MPMRKKPKLTFFVWETLHGNVKKMKTSWSLSRAEKAKTWEREAKTRQEPQANEFTQKWLYRERPVIETRCTLDRPIKAPVSSVMAPEFLTYSTALQCSDPHSFTHTGDRRTTRTSFLYTEMLKPKQRCWPDAHAHTFQSSCKSFTKIFAIIQLTLWAYIDLKITDCLLWQYNLQSLQSASCLTCKSWAHKTSKDRFMTFMYTKCKSN